MCVELAFTLSAAKISLLWLRCDGLRERRSNSFLDNTQLFLPRGYRGYGEIFWSLFFKTFEPLDEKSQGRDLHRRLSKRFLGEAGVSSIDHLAFWLGLAFRKNHDTVAREYGSKKKGTG